MFSITSVMQILENCRQLVVLILQGAIKPSQKKRAQQDNVINRAPDTKNLIRWKRWRKHDGNVPFFSVCVDLIHLFSSFQWQRGLIQMLHVQDHLLAWLFSFQTKFSLQQTASSQAQTFKIGFRSVTLLVHLHNMYPSNLVRTEYFWSVTLSTWQKPEKQEL